MFRVGEDVNKISKTFCKCRRGYQIWRKGWLSGNISRNLMSWRPSYLYNENPHTRKYGVYIETGSRSPSSHIESQVPLRDMMTSSNGYIFRVTGHLCGEWWRGALMFSLICVWINNWVNNREAGDLRRYRAHYDVIVMIHMLYNMTPAKVPLSWGAKAVTYRDLYRGISKPVFCLLLGVSSGSARPITGQVASVTWLVIGWAKSELTPSKRHKTGLGVVSTYAQSKFWSLVEILQ